MNALPLLDSLAGLSYCRDIPQDIRFTTLQCSFARCPITRTRTLFSITGIFVCNSHAASLIHRARARRVASQARRSTWRYMEWLDWQKHRVAGFEGSPPMEGA